MRNRNTRCSCKWTWEDEPNNRCVEVTIYGWAVPYTPASMYGGSDGLGHPAEGGYADDFEYRVESVTYYTEDGKVSRFLAGRDAQVEAEFAALEKDAALRERIEHELLEDAAAQLQPPED